MAAQGLVDKATSYLGHNNPFAHEVNPETDLVWLLDNTASQNPDRGGVFEADFVAAYFARKSGDDISKTVAEISKSLGLAEGDAKEKTIRTRLEPFFNAILPSKTVRIELSKEQTIEGNSGPAPVLARRASRAADEPTTHTAELGPSDRSGISTNRVALPGDAHRDGDLVHGQPVVPMTGSVTSHTTLATSQGYAVISDIDDTIKKTLTNTPTGILNTTFVDEPEPIAGMPDFYRFLNEKLDRPAFWYLSASPYNLYSFLHKFRDQYFPRGTMLLRQASWMNVAGFLASMSQDTKEYKVEEMKRVQRVFPDRKFIVIGDSTQSDPEAYGELARTHPNWIKAIFIRKVENVTEIQDILPGQSNEERNKPSRFEDAFKGLPSDLWHVFSDPKELYARVEAVVGR